VDAKEEWEEGTYWQKKSGGRIIDRRSKSKRKKGR
jgi:hypothetical protein